MAFKVGALVRVVCIRGTKDAHPMVEDGLGHGHGFLVGLGFFFYQVTEEDIIPRLSKILQIKISPFDYQETSSYYESTNGPKSIHRVTLNLRHRPRQFKGGDLVLS